MGFAGIMVVADEAELLNIAVYPGMRRSGVGQMLLDQMLQSATAAGARRLLLEVRKSNAEAIRLYEKNRFVNLGERKGYYRNPIEDAIIMERRLSDL